MIAHQRGRFVTSDGLPLAGVHSRFRLSIPTHAAGFLARDARTRDGAACLPGHIWARGSADGACLITKEAYAQSHLQSARRYEIQAYPQCQIATAADDR